VVLPIASRILCGRIQLAVRLDGRVHLTGSGAVSLCGPVQLLVMLGTVPELLALVARARPILGFLTALPVFDIALWLVVVVIRTHRVLDIGDLIRDGSGRDSGDDGQKCDDKELGHLGSGIDEAFEEVGGHGWSALGKGWIRCRAAAGNGFSRWDP
jgi:hypothetical protein